MKKQLIIVTALFVALGVAGAIWWRALPPAPADLDRFDPLVADAMRSVLRAARSRPWDVNAWRTLGLVYEANEAPELAAQCYQRVLESNANDARTWYRLACATEQFDSRAAISHIERAIGIDSSYAPLHWKRGWWLLDSGKAEPARQSFEAALRINPADRAAIAGLSMCLLQSDQSERAIAALEQQLQHQNDPYIRRLLGNAYLRAGRKNEAAVEFRRAGQAIPRWSDPWSDEMTAHITGIAVINATATDLMYAGDPSSAAKLLEPLTNQCPDHVLSMCNLGRAYGQLNRLDDALKCFDRARQIDPQSAHAREGLAVVWQARGDHEQALRWIDEAISFNGTSAQARLTRGMILLQLRRTNEAIEEFARAHGLQPSNLAPLIWKGRGHLILREWPRAEAAFQEAAEIDSFSAAAFAGLAEAQFHQGNATQARDSLERAVRLNPNEPGIGDVIQLVQP